MTWNILIILILLFSWLMLHENCLKVYFFPLVFQTKTWSYLQVK